MPNFRGLFVGIVLIFTFSTPGARAAAIEDPQGYLTQIEGTRALGGFAEAYRLNDQCTVRLLSRNCTFHCGEFLNDFLCASFCESWDASWPDLPKTLVEAGDETATAVLGDGTVEAYERLEFEAGKGGMLRKLLTGIDVFVGLAGKVKLESLKSVDYPMTGQPPVPAYQLTGAFEVDGGGTLELDIVVGKNVPGIAEILFLKVGPSKIFRVRSIGPRGVK